MHGLLRVCVTRIISLFVLIVIGLIAKFVIKFPVQGLFNERGHHFAHERVDIRPILQGDIVFFKEFSHLS